MQMCYRCFIFDLFSFNIDFVVIVASTAITVATSAGTIHIIVFIFDSNNFGCAIFIGFCFMLRMPIFHASVLEPDFNLKKKKPKFFNFLKSILKAFDLPVHQLNLSGRPTFVDPVLLCIFVFEIEFPILCVEVG